MNTRRDHLKNVQFLPGKTHMGLWFDAYIQDASKKAETNNGQKTKDLLLDNMMKLGESTIYKELYFDRWIKELTSAKCEFLTFTTITPLALNMGMASVVENNVALHHTYGVPYLTGSALKGICAAYAHQRLDKDKWRKADEKKEIAAGLYQRALFGDADEAGAVCFEDALPVPGSWHFKRDVVGSHHQDGSDKPPADWDNPIPSPFLSIWGTFKVPIRPTSPADAVWRSLALSIVPDALATKGLGLGAKTSSGYGRFEFEEKIV
jgi:CRISPR-associated protein Cmr6